jgi:hypothetical protein
MPCKSCGSVNESKFKAEMVVHHSGRENIQEPGVWVFPELTICSDCGVAQFLVPETELHLLTKKGAEATKSPGTES